MAPALLPLFTGICAGGLTEGPEARQRCFLKRGLPRTACCPNFALKLVAMRTEGGQIQQYPGRPSFALHGTARLLRHRRALRVFLAKVAHQTSIMLLRTSRYTAFLAQKWSNSSGSPRKRHARRVTFCGRAGRHGADGAAERLRRLGGMVYVRGHPQLNKFRLMPPPTNLVLRCAACVQEQRCRPPLT